MKDTKKYQPINLHTTDLIAHYWGSINNLTGLIKASELKAGLILSFYGILLNLIYQCAGHLLDSSKCDSITNVLIGLWICIAAISIYFSVRSFIPKIEATYDDNILFFGDIISKFGNIKEFSKTFYEISKDEERLSLQMGEQIYIISKIAAWKFEKVKQSIRFLVISLVLLFVTATYYGILSISR